MKEQTKTARDDDALDVGEARGAGEEHGVLELVVQDLEHVGNASLSLFVHSHEQR